MAILGALSTPRLMPMPGAQGLLCARASMLTLFAALRLRHQAACYLRLMAATMLGLHATHLSIARGGARRLPQKRSAAMRC